jgi:hypothetical protein
MSEQRYNEEYGVKRDGVEIGKAGTTIGCVLIRFRGRSSSLGTGCPKVGRFNVWPWMQGTFGELGGSAFGGALYCYGHFSYASTLPTSTVLR